MVTVQWLAAEDLNKQSAAISARSTVVTAGTLPDCLVSLLIITSTTRANSAIEHVLSVASHKDLLASTLLILYGSIHVSVFDKRTHHLHHHHHHCLQAWALPTSLSSGQLPRTARGDDGLHRTWHFVAFYLVI